MPTMTTLRARLTFMAGLGLLFLLIVGGIGLWGERRLVVSSERLEQVTESVRAQMQVDMMHDALRADVLNAFRVAQLSAAAQAKEMEAVKANLAEHSQLMQKSFASLEQHSSRFTPEVVSALGNVKPKLVQYINHAQSIVELASASAGMAALEWEAFSANFDTLETELEKVGDSIQADTKVINQEAKDTSRLALILTMLGMVIGAIILLINSRKVIGNIMRQLGGEPDDAAHLVRSVQQGNLDIDIRYSSQGSLLHSLAEMVDQLKAFVTAQAVLSRQHAAGDIDQRLDDKQFPGVYGEIAAQNNALITSHIDLKMQIVAMINQYAQGDFSQVMPDLPGKKRSISDALKRIRSDLQQVESEGRTNLRIRVALDNVSVPVTVSNRNEDIIYLNHSAMAFWRDLEPSIRRYYSEFSAANLSGRRISGIFQQNDQRANFEQAIDKPVTMDCQLAGRHLRITASPVRDDEGNYLGRVTQWYDRSAEVEAEREIASLVDAATLGDFSQRIDLSNKSGFFAQVGGGLNQLLDLSGDGLDEISRMLAALAEGDLTYRIHREFQGVFAKLKDDSNTTAERLQVILQQVREAAETIREGTQQLAEGNHNLSVRTEEQAVSLEETSTSMSALTTTVRQNAENAKVADELATGATLVARKGGEVVGQVVSTMQQITQSAKNIGEITSVIDSIAFQTNILALNAAVEAARAGEQGRGFAVVANEVRNLAQRAAAAAKEIKQLINTSVENIRTGAQYVDVAGQTMDEIVSSIQRVGDLMQEIRSASASQTDGIEQINIAITQMDDNTQKNAALVEQAAAAAQSMEEQAAQMVATVAKFRLSEQTLLLPALPSRRGETKRLAYQTF